MNFFFPFSMVCIFDFCKYINRYLYILFLVNKSMTQIINISFENYSKLVGEFIK